MTRIGNVDQVLLLQRRNIDKDRNTIPEQGDTAFLALGEKHGGDGQRRFDGKLPQQDPTRHKYRSHRKNLGKLQFHPPFFCAGYPPASIYV